MKFIFTVVHSKTDCRLSKKYWYLNFKLLLGHQTEGWSFFASLSWPKILFEISIDWDVEY